MRGMVFFTLLMIAAAVNGDTVFDAGEWRVDFSPSSKSLKLSHPATGTELSGTLSFLGPAKANASETMGHEVPADRKWQIEDPRDGARQRLALIDPNGDAQGYVTFQPDGGRLRLLVYHRTALAYPGTLSFQGTAKFFPDAFAARTRSPGGRVLQLAAGDADSLLNDTLFSPENDCALRLDAAKLTLSAHPGTGWDFGFEGRIDDAAQAEFTIALERDYYKNRWVPYYKPIDRSRAPHPPTGWMSWNTYFDKAGSKENLAEARLGAKFLKPFGLEIWSIESWQANSSELPVSKFHNMNLEHHPEQFPEGMKWLAGEIRKLGFRPGLWVAPFGTGNEGFYRAHRDWFLHRSDGSPVGCWNGKYTLDPTVKAAREHLRGIFDKASHDWGYEFFKIDGMSGRGPGYCAHLYERPEIRKCFSDPSCPNPFELCVKAFRDGIGPDRILLACQGHFTGAEAAYADASRTGADIVHPNQPVKWANILLQARCTINQIFAHNVVFWSDPDCMMISQQALDIEQARVETTVVALPGQQMFAGDKLGELAPDRIRLLQQSLPVCDVHPVALCPRFGHLPVWDLAVRRKFGSWHVAALFNWGDQPQRIGVDWGEIGEDPKKNFLGWEFWEGKWLGRLQSRLELEVPPRSVRLVALQPDAGRPQFLTSDRHLTQGAVEVKNSRWDNGKLTTEVEAVGGFPLTLRFTVPKGFSCEGVAQVPGAVLRGQPESNGEIYAVTAETPETRTVALELKFTKTGN